MGRVEAVDPFYSFSHEAAPHPNSWVGVNFIAGDQGMKEKRNKLFTEYRNEQYNDSQLIQILTELKNTRNVLIKLQEGNIKGSMYKHNFNPSPVHLPVRKASWT